PVTIRLLDPPLHEFVPTKKEAISTLSNSLGIKVEDFNKRAALLHETNPMMGHRGVRLGVTYPEVTEMQVRAVLEAAVELTQAGKKVNPEIMVPVVSAVKELDETKKVVNRVYAEVKKKYNVKKIAYMFGTMIEIPRAALTADQLAVSAEFFSFGTNDLTQMSFGFSRDDIGGFLPEYLDSGILDVDPFQSIDQTGVGELIKIGVERGRKVRSKLKIGICGEHGGDPASIEFCQKVGMDYVSCSPYRVPIARLAAAQAAVRAKSVKKTVKKRVKK
ncbi:MAG: pyruvate,orthophosphate dikinase, partial [Lysobacterales bacterium]